jgi:SAM-dependent methyltransferase
MIAGDAAGGDVNLVDSCRFCGGAAAYEYTARELQLGLRHEFTYARCAGCGSLWLRDVPSDLAEYYAAGYYSMVKDRWGAIGSPLVAVWTRVMLRLPAICAIHVAGRHRRFPAYLGWFAGARVSVRSRVADVGSGEAGLVMRLSRDGFDEVWGFDPFIGGDRDSGNAHYRRHRLRDADGSFDVIMFNHSLEHMPDPVGELQIARRLLRRDGTILVRVPVAGCYSDRHYGASWRGLDAPRHLAIPSRAGMRHAADAAGLRITRTFFDSLGYQFWESEQYARGIAAPDWPPIDPSLLKVLHRRARALNRRGDGATAGFVLRS